MTLGLLPVPHQAHVSEDTSAIGRSNDRRGEVEVVFLDGMADARIEARVQTLLSANPQENAWLDTLEISVDQIADQLPSCGVDESYQLVIEIEGEVRRAHLSATTTWGALHGVTTLGQLSVAAQSEVPKKIEIQDSPRFPWRGLLVDVARHFISFGLLKRVVDGMARLKMNVLHLHLTDDQAFRFSSDTFPKLASKQCYSRAELQELVEYAGNLGVRVVPEMDVPGHVNSWLSAYPEWGLQPVTASSKFGVHKACLNPCDETVYKALDGLFQEVCAVFPDEYVHLGGDEVHPAWWSEDEGIQAFIAEQKLGDVRGLQAYFNRRLCELLAARGRKAIGWDEVLHDAMPSLLVQNWRGATTRDRALARGLDVLVSSGYYVDLFFGADTHYQFDPEAPQEQLVGFENDIRQDRRLRHVAAGLAWTDQWREESIDIDVVNIDKRGRVLGGEACLWAELVDENTLETRLWSRLPAVAERFWSHQSVVDIADFYQRLNGLLAQPYFALREAQARDLVSVGLQAEQVDVALLLEPVKWYARLLGEQALQARLTGREMPQARPYDANTPLNRVVDMISPESLSALKLRQYSRAELEQAVVGWRASRVASWPEDVRPAIQGLIQVAQIMSEFLADELAVDDARSQLWQLYQPWGEYMLAPIPALVEWLDARQ